MQSLDVRIWDIRAIKRPTKTTYKVRWVVAGREFSKTYAAKALADSRRSELLAAQRRGEAFDCHNGLPESEVRSQPTSVTWYQNAIEFMDTVWHSLEPGSRRKLAEALATVTLALTEPPIDPLDHAFCFRWLVCWSFNSRARVSTIPADEDAAAAITWIADHSVPMSALNDPKMARRAYNSTTTDQFGKPFAVNTYRNKKKGLSGAVNYAIEMGRLDTNPLERISTNPPRRNTTVDRRVVVNPPQARSLIEAVRDHGATGSRLAAFFALLYFAGLRPSEALVLRRSDCVPPARGWGELCFAESVPTRMPGGPMTARPVRASRSSTARAARAGQSRHVPNSSPTSRPTSRSSAPHPTAGSSSVSTAERSGTRPTRRSGRVLEKPHSRRSSLNHHWPSALTTCVMLRYPPGSTPESRPRKSPNGLATALRCY